MMRGLRRAVVAVRTADGSIAVRERELNLERRVFWARIPLLRGIQLLGDALVIGIWALMASAALAPTDPDAPASPEKPLTRLETTLLIATSLGFSIALFFVLPLLAASGLASLLDLGIYGRETIEGLARLAIFVGYLALVGRMPDIRRVFGYHGAEHKAVSAYEAGLPLTVEHVRPLSTIHPRCGTTLLLLVVALSIPVFALLGSFPFWVRLLSRIVLVPFVAALAYELMRFTARRPANPLIRQVMRPALALQKLTTREPDDQMIEVAIVALSQVLAADGQIVETQSIPVQAQPALTS